MGMELLKNEGRESVLKSLWHHSDAVMCCSLKVCLKFSLKLNIRDISANSKIFF